MSETFDFDFDLNELYSKLMSVDTSENHLPSKCSNSRRFPEMLYRLLQQDNHPQIISWLPDGKSFKIHKRNDFEQYLLSSYFDDIKFRSFQRQLNIYGFVRLDNGIHSYTYGHKLFAKDKHHNLPHIKRIPIKGKSNVQKSKKLPSLE